MAVKRRSNIYDPASAAPFRFSRSKIENYMRCQRCSYLDRRLGVSEPDGYPFNLNSAVDHLLKKEFDVHRAKGSAHPLMESYGVDAIPFDHPEMGRWRENFVGVQYHHPATNFIITGAVDDIWVNPKGELHVVDYKATSKEGEVTLDADWQDGYKRQMEIYQWLLRRVGFKVSDTGYFVYANGKRDRAAFDAKLEFDVKIIPYTGDDSWLERTIKEIHKTLSSDVLPASGVGCQYCLYRAEAERALKPLGKKPRVKKQNSLFGP
ncbi:MAG: PD-(D/E)XK nuclease family protein [Patescibacteria group bacterium]